MGGCLHLNRQRAPDACTRTEEVAAQLGTFNAHHLEHPLLDPPAWLSRSWLRSWFELTVPGVLVSLRTVSPEWSKRVSEVVDIAYAVDLITRLWRRRTDLHQRVAAIPKTLCHLDAHRQNLFRVTADRTIAIAPTKRPCARVVAYTFRLAP